jgi:BirA family biotin operon repressor/biotin-[acetyl-CoA-carboxylase] ligase
MTGGSAGAGNARDAGRDPVPERAGGDALPHVHFDEVGSTMEAARAAVTMEAARPAMAAGNAGAEAARDFLLVTAAAQTGGRGTRGRPWHSPRGNVYLTLAIHRRLLPPARLALFPLEASLALHAAVSALLPPGARGALRLKWPNDLLWEDRKAAGMLLEAAGDHVFVGAGVNITAAPAIDDGGTPSARLADAGLAEEAALEVARGFGATLRTRLLAAEKTDGIVSAWRERAAWHKPLRLRDRPGRPEVMPLDINAEGHLRVRFADGREEWLVSDYLA